MSATRTSALLATLALAGALLSAASSAQTLLNIPGPTFGFADFGDSALADSWTQSFSVTNGSVSVDVQGLDPTGGPINFYLTNALGPTATLSNLVAFTSMQVPFALTTVTPFSNLNLAPGTYYMVMADYTPNNTTVNGPDWNYLPTAASGIQTAPGLTLNAMQSTSSLSMFAPASVFSPVSLAIDGVISFTGTASTTTTAQAPEIDPSSMASAMTLLLGLLVVLTSRRRATFPAVRCK